MISVVMPLRNCEAYVERAIASVLAQDVRDLELIVVDDGGTDRSVELVRAIRDDRIRITPGPRGGIAAAMNAGLALVQGDFFCRCDADDWYEPDRLAGQRQFLVGHAEYGAICGRYTLTSATGQPLLTEPEHADPAEITAELQRGVGRTHLNTFLVRTPLVRQLEGFRSYFIGTEDADFQLRLSEVTRIWYEPVACYGYRLHGESITHTQPNAQRRFLEATMLEFQKQRRQTGSDDLMRGSPPPLPPTDPSARAVEDQMFAVLLGRAWREHRSGKRRDALASNWRACMTAPTRLAGWKSLAALLIKPAGKAGTGKAGTGKAGTGKAGAGNGDAGRAGAGKAGAGNGDAGRAGE